MSNPTDNTTTTARPRQRRQSRYIKAQERRDAQKRADQRFYNTIFSLIGACVLVVLTLAALAQSGTLTEGSGGSDTVEGAERVTLLGLTAIEWVGLVIVAIIGVFMWRRISKR